MASRLVLLFVALLAITAGCNSAPAATPTDDTTASTTSPSTTACTTTYQPSNPQLPANETRTLPERPETLNATSVETIVRETEQVVPFNERYESRFDYVSVDVGDVDVEETDDGYEVTIDHVGWTTRASNDGRTVVGDYAWSAYYVVNESSIARSQAPTAVSDPPEPTVLHCWNSTV